MNFRQLEVFRAVMISGSASRAAELLRITQPAVSRSLSDLEGVLGFPLFDRLRGRLSPTPEGQLFFRDVAASFTGLDHLRASAARIRDFGSGSLRVASLAALSATLVPRAIRAFRDAHPEVAITLQVASSPTVRELVASGQFDVGLAADEVDLSGVDHRPFCELQAVCVLPPGHPLGGKAVIGPKDLHGQPFIALAPEDRARRRMEDVLEAADSHPRIVVETPGSATVCALALEGVGIGLANPAAAEGYAERGLQIRPFMPAVTFKAHTLFRPDARKSREVKRFVTELLTAKRTWAFPWLLSDSKRTP